MNEKDYKALKRVTKEIDTELEGIRGGYVSNRSSVMNCKAILKSVTFEDEAIESERIADTERLDGIMKGRDGYGGVSKTFQNETLGVLGDIESLAMRWQAHENKAYASIKALDDVNKPYQHFVGEEVKITSSGRKGTVVSAKRNAKTGAQEYEVRLSDGSIKNCGTRDMRKIV